MAENPFLPLSFIAGPAILTNATAVLLNGASIRYSLAMGLWRDLQAQFHGHDPQTTVAYADAPREPLLLAHRRVVLIVRGLTLLYAAVGGFGLSTLIGLIGAMLMGVESGAMLRAAIALIVLAGGFGLVALLAAVAMFALESRCTIALLRLGIERAPLRPRHRGEES